MLAGRARLGKGHWPTPPFYLLWWVLCILLHCPHINGPAVERISGCVKKIAVTGFVIFQKYQLFSASLYCLLYKSSEKP